MTEEGTKTPNAKKWTEERVKAHLDILEKDMHGEHCFFLGSALMRQGLPKHVWSYWKQVFAENDDLIERMLFIDSFFEAKIFEAGLKKELPSVIAIRTLKFVYGWNGNLESIIHNKFNKF